MSHVRFAISPARSPALADSRAITVLRSGCRVQLAKTSRSPTSVTESIFARFPAISASRLEMYYTTISVQAEQQISTGKSE
jgi:hypothetical protein